MKQHSTYITTISNTAFGEPAAGKFVVSKLNQYSRHENRSPLSIKLVLEGTENYLIDHRRYTLRTGQFVVANLNDPLEIEVDTSDHTYGICIYPPDSLVQDAFHTATHSLDQLLEEKGASQQEFSITQKVNSLNENLNASRFLKQNLPYILQAYETNQSIDFESFYAALASSLAADQLQVEKQLTRLTSTKKHTQEELYRRLYLSRDYIKDNFTRKISVDELAELSCLSKYHFIRSFKALFKLTPYQYLLHEKLLVANELIQQHYSYAQIAELTGFSDPKNLKKALRQKPLPQN